MLRLLADENFNRRIVRGLRLVLPGIDCLIAQDEGLTAMLDPDLLRWAAERGRILLTHDVNTIPMFAFERVAAGEGMCGVIAVPKNLAIGVAIEEEALVAECSEAADLDGHVLHLPL